MNYKIVKDRRRCLSSAWKRGNHRFLSVIIMSNARVSSYLLIASSSISKATYEYNKRAQFEGFNVKKILEFARDNSDIDDIFHSSNLVKSSREYRCNLNKCTYRNTIFLTYTLIKDKFQKFIYDAIKKRETKVI